MRTRVATVTAALLVLCFVGFQSRAQFNKSDIDDLKADLLNYADSQCTNETYLKSATDIMGKLSSPISSTITPEQAKANDQLRDALSGVRGALMSSMMGDKSLCPQKIRDGIKKLNDLPIKTSPKTAPPPPNGADGQQ